MVILPMIDGELGVQRRPGGRWSAGWARANCG